MAMVRKLTGTDGKWELFLTPTVYKIYCQGKSWFSVEKREIKIHGISWGLFFVYNVLFFIQKVHNFFSSLLLSCNILL